MALLQFATANMALLQEPHCEYNLINNFSIIACGARRARSCATAYLLTGAQPTLRAGIVCDDRELFLQIIVHVFSTADMVPTGLEEVGGTARLLQSYYAV